ncbi:uncharacterized protein LOC114289666 [Camellia sinensis]|uniref:uncharacterized protein LOC114289666 n=1 Tax=Camellia sinensis TaxID=4442 RepID=UPI001036A828|nr:uncharacterized protein LOC114289666 [Camellia sinensis]
MKTLFQSQGLWNLIQNGYDEPDSTTTLTSAQEQQLEETRKKEAKALFFIQQALSDELFPRIIEAKKSNEAWDILQQEFQGDKKVRIIKLPTLRRELKYLKMKESETLTDYFSKLMEIVNQMKSYGERVEQKRIVEKILVSLPEKYNTMVGIIEETKDISEMSVQELMGSLKAHEQRLLKQLEKPLESAFQSKVNLNSKSHGESSNLEQNLLNVRQFVEHGYAVHFEVNSCTIHDINAKQVERRSKLDETSEKCIFVGYNNKSKGYQLYSLNKNQIIISRDVLFDENASWNWEEGKIEKQSVLVDEEQENSTHEYENDEDSHQFSPRTGSSSSSSSSPSSSSNSTSSSPSSTPNN